MKPFQGITAKTKYYTFISAILLIFIAAGLSFLHHYNHLRQHEKRENALLSLNELSGEFESLAYKYMNDSSAVFMNNDTALTLLAMKIMLLLEEPGLFDDRHPAFDSLQVFRNEIHAVEETIMLALKEQNRESSGGLHSEQWTGKLQRLNHLRHFMLQQCLESNLAEQRTLLVDLYAFMGIILLMISAFIVISNLGMIGDLRRLSDFSAKLDKGSRPGKIYLSSSAEFFEIAANLNRLTDKLDEKINFLKTVGENRNDSSYIPENSDLLGNEIKKMSDRLSRTMAEAEANQEAEKIRIWTSEGIARFGDILRSERENVTELSYLIIKNLVTYLEIEMGTLFLAYTAEDGQKSLQALSSYAYDRRKYMNKTFLFGEGLPGTCALEKEKIYINEIPDDYSDVISGVGQTKPGYVLLVPLKIENEIFGILEMASFRALKKHEMAFIDQIADSIASTLLSVRTTERTNELLSQSRKQAEKLLRQEEDLRINLQKLENAQSESEKKESEITGVLNAMNESSLVAEFSVHGRFIEINNKFLNLLELTKDQVLGKHHNEFARVDRYSDAYKKFWSDLKSGEPLSKEEVYTLYSGKEVWLKQSFTPIKNQDHKVYKILNIAIDITEVKMQQENLSRQAAEITRANLEMESLEQAVDSAIIKCEMDAEGIVLDINSNFTETTGLTRKEVLGRNYRMFLKDIEKEQFEKIWLEVMKGKKYEGAVRRSKPTGEEVWLMSTFSPVENESGEIYKIYLLALDITEKKLKYQLLEEANKEIERLKEMVEKAGN